MHSVSENQVQAQPRNAVILDLLASSYLSWGKKEDSERAQSRAKALRKDQHP